MAWLRNYYECERCSTEWTDEWSCACDDDCPSCGARHISPFESDDLSEISDYVDGAMVLLRSSDQAEHGPEYEVVAYFPLGASG
jgi:hypothetical protein